MCYSPCFLNCSVPTISNCRNWKYKYLWQSLFSCYSGFSILTQLGLKWWSHSALQLFSNLTASIHTIAWRGGISYICAVSTAHFQIFVQFLNSSNYLDNGYSSQLSRDWEIDKINIPILIQKHSETLVQVKCWVDHHWTYPTFGNTLMNFIYINKTACGHKFEFFHYYISTEVMFQNWYFESLIRVSMTLYAVVEFYYKFSTSGPSSIDDQWNSYVLQNHVADPFKVIVQNWVLVSNLLTFQITSATVCQQTISCFTVNLRWIWHSVPL